jgi:hypothetical protein
MTSKGEAEMEHAFTAAPAKTVLYGALEMSKSNWLLAIQFPDRTQPSLYPIKGGDTEGLMAKVMAVRERWTKSAARRLRSCCVTNVDTMPFGWRGSSSSAGLNVL